MAKKRSSVRGGTFTVCDLGNGNLRIQNVRVNIIDIAGHTSSANLDAVTTNAVPGSLAPGKHQAIKVNGQYQDDPILPVITVQNPCNDPNPELFLVVHHYFAPNIGGTCQVLCEMIPARIDFCQTLRPCGPMKPTTRTPKSRKRKK